jgi:type III secretion protein HrpB1
MSPSMQSKEFVAGLIDVISQGISHNRLEDAEAVLDCVRALRPKLAELDTFDAWISIKRGFWQDAVRTLRGIDSTATNWSLGRALLAFCQFALGDAEWSLNANEVMTNSGNAEAISLVRLLLGQENALDDSYDVAAAMPDASGAGANHAGDMMAAFMRA